MKFTFGKYGLKENPIGAQVTWTIKGRQYLADVRDCYRAPVTGALMLKVRHFNGETAPDVAAGFVDVLRFGMPA
jgi:hypothetical protein